MTLDRFIHDESEREDRRKANRSRRIFPITVPQPAYLDRKADVYPMSPYIRTCKNCAKEFVEMDVYGQDNSDIEAALEPVCNCNYKTEWKPEEKEEHRLPSYIAGLTLIWIFLMIITGYVHFGGDSRGGS